MHPVDELLGGESPHAGCVPGEVGVVEEVAPLATCAAVHLEDDDHLLFTDNGEVEPTTDRANIPTPLATNDWFVRCTLTGQCERATSAKPGKGLTLSLAGEYAH